MFKRVAAWCKTENDLRETATSHVFREYRLVDVIAHFAITPSYTVIFEKEVSE